MRQSFQRGSVIRVQQKSGPIWRFRFRDNGIQRSEYLGSLKALPTKAHAEKAADRFRRKINSNIECITVADLTAKFWRECPPARETTAHGYRSIFARIEAEWGHLRIDALAAKTSEIEQWLSGLKTVRGRKRDTSSLYKAQVRNLLHMLCERAMAWGHLPVDRNPISVIRLKDSSQRKKELVVLSAEQYRRLLEDPELLLLVKVMVQMAAALGLRVSEILGLRWTDFDFEAATVRIRGYGELESRQTKTQSSAAVLPLHPEIAAMLHNWRESAPVVKGWVFGSERTGRPYDRDYLRSEYLQPAGARIGLKGLGWHSFRHTYRSLMRKNGISLEDQKSLMRHSKLSTTVDVYGGDEQVEELRAANTRIVETLMGRSA